MNVLTKGLEDMKAYKKKQIIKHALEFYIQRPGASTQDRKQETQLWEEVCKEAEEMQRVYNIEIAPMTKRQRMFVVVMAENLGLDYNPDMSRTEGHCWIVSNFDEYNRRILEGDPLP